MKKHIGLALSLAMMAEAMQVQETYIHERNDSSIFKTKPRKHLGTSTRIKVRTEPKIRVNEPCPCGSGKKAKKCCHPKF